MTLRIVEDDLTGPEIIALLERHLETMRSQSPPESVHALDLDGLKARQVTFWSVYDGDALVGCGALKELDARHGEIKSMHTAAEIRGRGVAAAMVGHILTEARRRSYSRLSLETGSTEDFASAHRLYRRFGFTECGPFGEYRLDPFSVFMTLEL